MNWKPIEKLDTNKDIWVIKYDMYYANGTFCDKNTLGAIKFTNCHGWYDTEEDALKVVAHFPTPTSYYVERVHHRSLI